ncbi:kinesin-like protein KIN-14I [Forsythia ovata]|uniref:Kinesin-like protein KIN-14I n=1 Tax=Forsythia ovata TaxID=205694 RepID=A0ABD1T6H4_9LAMI
MKGGIINILEFFRDTKLTHFVYDRPLQEDVYEKQKKEIKMKEELESLKDELRSQKQYLEEIINERDKLRASCDEKDSALQATILEKQSIEVRLAKVSSQGLENNMRKELTEANNQVLHKTQDELKARSAKFHAVEESKGNLQVRKHLFKKELQGLKGRMLMR